MHSTFSKRLLSWHKTTDRQLPWKTTREPYNIWISEVIMQQTQIIQGLAYYERIIKTFPQVEDMASAQDDEIMYLWKGLGYYSRARNMHKAAKIISERYNGQFPKEYKSLLALPGIGPYTASAIMSFAYDQPYAVVDGNVFRVLSRVFGIMTPIDTSIGQKEFAQKSQVCLEKTRPAEYNQAIMDFGALVCSPRRPLCDICPLNDICQANIKGMVSVLPIKSKKIKRRKRYFNYFMVRCEDYYLIEKREQKDIWEGLYQFPLIETTKKSTVNEMQQLAIDLLETEVQIDSQEIYNVSKMLTHQELQIAIIPVTIKHSNSKYVKVLGARPP